MLSKTLLVVLLVFCIGLLVESRYVGENHLDGKITSTGNTRNRYGSVFKRRRRSAENDEEKTVESDSSEEENTSTHITSAEAETLIKFFSAMAWEGDKYSFLTSILEEFADSDSNITLIGWQHVYDGDNLKDVKGIQIVIPPKPDDDEVGNFEDDEEDNDDEDDEDWGIRVPPHLIEEMRDIMEPFETFGINAAVFHVEFGLGRMQHELYLDANEMFVSKGYYRIYDRTIHNASDETVQKVINFAKQTHHHAILKHESYLKVLEEGSVLDPHVLTQVADISDVPAEIYVKAPAIFAEALVFHYMDCPKYLVESFNKAFPEYTWRAITDVRQYQLTYDIHLMYHLEPLDFGRKREEYNLYGIKKAEQE